jgi:hypothetical protein
VGCKENKTPIADLQEMGGTKQRLNISPLPHRQRDTRSNWKALIVILPYRLSKESLNHGFQLTTNRVH